MKIAHLGSLSLDLLLLLLGLVLLLLGGKDVLEPRRVETEAVSRLQHGPSSAIVRLTERRDPPSWAKWQASPVQGQTAVSQQKEVRRWEAPLQLTAASVAGTVSVAGAAVGSAGATSVVSAGAAGVSASTAAVSVGLTSSTGAAAVSAAAGVCLDG